MVVDEAKAVRNSTIPDAYVRFHNNLNHDLETYVTLYVAGVIFWPSDGGIKTIKPREAIKVSAAWSLGTYYVAHGKNKGTGKSTYFKFVYEGLDLYADIDLSAPAGFIIIAAVRDDNKTKTS